MSNISARTRACFIRSSKNFKPSIKPFIGKLYFSLCFLSFLRDSPGYMRQCATEPPRLDWRFPVYLWHWKYLAFWRPSTKTYIYIYTKYTMGRRRRRWENYCSSKNSVNVIVCRVVVFLFRYLKSITPFEKYNFAKCIVIVFTETLLFPVDILN